MIEVANVIVGGDFLIAYIDENFGGGDTKFGLCLFDGRAEFFLEFVSVAGEEGDLWEQPFVTCAIAVLSPEVFDDLVNEVGRLYVFVVVNVDFLPQILFVDGFL